MENFKSEFHSVLLDGFAVFHLFQLKLRGLAVIIGMMVV